MTAVIIIVAVLAVLALVAFVVLPRTRARAQERRLEERRGEMADRHRALKSFLYDRLYHHHRVTRMTQKADRIMSALFEVYMHEPRQLPPHVTGRTVDEDETMPRVIADYIAGMTDRFALEEYKKLFDPNERV